MRPPLLQLCCLSPLCCLTIGIASHALADNRAEESRQILDQAGVQRGVCAIVTADGWGTRPLDLARHSELFVHVRCRDAAAASRLAQAARAAGLGIDRLAVESGSLATLPYAENLIDVLIVPDWSADDAGLPSQGEMLRVLRPRGRRWWVARRRSRRCASRHGRAKNSARSLWLEGTGRRSSSRRRKGPESGRTGNMGRTTTRSPRMRSSRPRTSRSTWHIRITSRCPPSRRRRGAAPFSPSDTSRITNASGT